MGRRLMVSAVTLRRPLPTFPPYETLPCQPSPPLRLGSRVSARSATPSQSSLSTTLRALRTVPAAERAEALAAHQLDAFHGGERQGVEVACRRAVGRAVHQHGQRLPAGKQITEYPGVQQLLKVLGAGALEKVALQLDDDPRRGREGAGVSPRPPPARRKEVSNTKGAKRFFMRNEMPQCRPYPSIRESRLNID